MSGSTSSGPGPNCEIDVMGQVRTNRILVVEDQEDNRRILRDLLVDTDWEHAGITGTTVIAMIVRGLIQRDPARRLWRTKEGRAVLAALLAKCG